MKLSVPCENCGKKVVVDTRTLPKINPIALRADKTGTREVYVDCPHCGGETVAVIPIKQKKS